MQLRERLRRWLLDVVRAADEDAVAAEQVTLGQQPVDYQTTLSYHVLWEVAESETVARQAAPALAANALDT